MSDNPEEAEDIQTRIQPAPPKAPGWVKVFIIVAVALVVLVVIGLFTGQLGPKGSHGPGRHMPGGDTPSEQRP